jgi:hypothetical protein
MDFGSRHSYRSHHVQTLLATSRSACGPQFISPGS